MANMDMKVADAPDRVAGVEWVTAPGPVAYEDALAEMESRVNGIIAGGMDERVWLLEHPPLYTAGTSADPAELLDNRFPVYATGRGGRYTYHGPGQRVAYLMLDLRERGTDVRAYVRSLEAWVIGALAAFGVTGEPRDDRIGIWVPDGNGGEAKIAAVGVRIRRWVTFHGIAVNVDPDLEHFSGIVPCGISDYGVTSLARLGIGATLADLDAALAASFQEVF